MRTTYNAVSRNMQYIIVNRYNDLAKQQEILSTGKRLLRPSDDPVDVANDLKLKSKVTRLSQHKRNIQDGMGYMEVTDTAMGSMNTILQRSRELAIQGANDTLSSAERRFIAEEVEQLLRQVVSISNTEYKGDYIFGGTNTKISPFPLYESEAATTTDYINYEMAYFDGTAPMPVQLFEGNTGYAIQNIIPGTFNLSVGGVQMTEGVDYTLDYITGQIDITNPIAQVDTTPTYTVPEGNPNYQLGQVAISFQNVSSGRDIYGNIAQTNGNILREIEDGITAPINITADEVFNDSTSGQNLIDTIINLGVRLLRDDNIGIENSIGELDTNFETLLAAQAKNGSRLNRFETTLDRNELQYVETTRRQSELEDADLAEEVTKFSVMETVYNAALQSGAKIIQPSLVNFL